VLHFIKKQRKLNPESKVGHEIRCRLNSALFPHRNHGGLPVTPSGISRASYNHGQKSWDTFAFLGRFPIHTGPTPPLTPQIMLDACIQSFLRVLTLYSVGGGRTPRNIRKGCTVLRGNREMTEKHEYCSIVLRTFVQDCSYSKTVSAREVRCCGIVYLFSCSKGKLFPLLNTAAVISFEICR